LFGGVERDDANRVAVLAGHQIADEGFEVGLIDIGFRKCSAQVSKIVDDEKNGLIGAARHNRRNKAPAHEKLQTQRFLWNLSTKPRRRNRSELPPTALAMMSGEGFGVGAHAMSASVIAATRSMSEIGVTGPLADMSESTRLTLAVQKLAREFSHGLDPKETSRCRAIRRP
jgi:hypothetical protein